MLRTILFSFAIASLGACSWSSFDDLGGEMWVDSVGGAEGVKPSDFLAVASPGTTTQNSVFVALGRSTDSLGAYRYDPDGILASEGVEVRAGNTFGFGPLAPEAVLAGDPYSNRVGMAATTGAVNEGDTKIASVTVDDLDSVVPNDFNSNGASVLDGAIQPTGLVYAQTDDEADLTTTDAVLARGAQIAMVEDYANTGQRLAGCLGATTNDVVLSVGRGQFQVDADDELVAVINNMLGSAPQIVIFNGSAVATTWTNDTTALNTCFDDGDLTRATIARVNGPTGTPSFGRRMVVADFDDDGDPDIAVAAPDDNAVTAYIHDGLTPPGFTQVNVAPTPSAGGFGTSLAAGDLDGQPGDELVIGAPQTNFDGAEHGGLAAVYTFDGTAFNQEFEVHDIQPSDEQRLGASVAVVPWDNGGHNVLVVGGDHEIFT
jgi:hypothetical protein